MWTSEVILEGIVTTKNADGSANISPMGPLVNDTMTRFVLRPYQTSRTYQNLKRLAEGVLHVTDDVELLARAAVSALHEPPTLLPCPAVNGWVLADACRWYAFRVSSLDDSTERTRIDCDVVEHGRLRDFFGFNRAKHAVIEAAILATRLEFLPRCDIEREYERLAIIVNKTAGEQERHAFDFLNHHVHQAWEKAVSD